MSQRIPFKQRPKITLPPLKSKFEAAVLNIASAFKETAGFKHAQTKGNERERPIRNFFEQNLPSAYTAVSGEIIDVFGEVSPQMDVIIYNKVKNSVFVSGASHILPAEAPLVTIEVKSQINSDEIKKSLEAAQKLKNLKPLANKLSSARTGNRSDKGLRYFHCLFAYSTDLIDSEDWGKREYERLLEASSKTAISSNIIDRIYVADKGMLFPERAMAVAEDKGNGLALFQFFLHVTNFILREDQNRAQVDYTNYSKGMIVPWQKLK